MCIYPRENHFLSDDFLLFLFSVIRMESVLNRLRSSMSSAATSAVSNAVQIASQVSNYLPGNPVTREFEATAHVASAGQGKLCPFQVFQMLMWLYLCSSSFIPTCDGKFLTWYVWMAMCISFSELYVSLSNQFTCSLSVTWIFVIKQFIFSTLCSIFIFK